MHENQASTFCSKCGANIALEEKICPKCRTPKSENVVVSACTKCEAPLQPWQRFCPTCGSAVDKGDSKKLSKKNLIVLLATVGGVMTVAIIAFIVVSLITSPINQFTRALRGGNYQDAVSLFNENKTDEKFETKSSKELTEFLKAFRNDYVNEKIMYGEATDALNSVKTIIPTTDVADFINKVKASKEAFSAAESAFAKSDYYTALSQYSKVIADDANNFKKAKEAITESKTKLNEQVTTKAGKLTDTDDYKGAIDSLQKLMDSSYADSTIAALLDKAEEDYTAHICKIAINSANGFAAKDDFLAAYNVLNEVDNSRRNNDFTSLMAEMKTKATQKVNNEAQSLYDSGDYLGAFDYLNGVDGAVLDPQGNALKSSAKDKYTQQISTEADNKAQSGDYEGAMNILDKAINKFADSELKDKYKKYSVMKMENDLQNWDCYVTSTKYVVQDTRWKSLYPDMLQAIIKNNTNYDIKDAVVAFVAWDQSNLPVNIKANIDFSNGAYVRHVNYDNINLTSGKTFGSNSGFEIDETCGIKKFKAIVVSYTLFDDTKRINPYFNRWENIYSGKKLEE